MALAIGIDLGTTFSCAAWVNTDDGRIHTIPGSDGTHVTPSILWFNGRRAVVGSAADGLRSQPQNFRELFKRHMGLPLEEAPYYRFEGYDYGATGMSALVLRKLKRDAIAFFKTERRLPADADERTTDLAAVITVPHYFKDAQRQDTRMAAFAAGLRVINVLNEPMAAALSFGLTHQDEKRILVFDLGGGTFDVTILHTDRGRATALGVHGISDLGGTDWDNLIVDYLLDTYAQRTGCAFPERQLHDIHRVAILAKHALTDVDQTTVSIGTAPDDIEVVLHRNSRIGGATIGANDYFDLDERSTMLRHQIDGACRMALEKSGLRWEQLDEIVMVGGACRMPMIPTYIEQVSGRAVARRIEGIDPDTAVAVGAALSAAYPDRYQDILSHRVAILLREGSTDFTQTLLEAGARLPASVEKTFDAEEDAAVEIFEGASSNPAECELRGRVDLRNAAGRVVVRLDVDLGGMLSVAANGTRAVFANDVGTDSARAAELRQRVQAIELEP